MNEEWFIDKRTLLHCCICGVYQNDIIANPKLYNHKVFKRILCSLCLPQCKEMINQARLEERERIAEEMRGKTMCKYCCRKLVKVLRGEGNES